MAGEEEWKENTEIWKAKGRAMDTNTGESPGYQSHGSPYSLETHLVRSERTLGTYGRWAHGTMDWWMYEKNWKVLRHMLLDPRPSGKNCHTFSDPLPLELDVLYGQPL